MTKTEKVQNEKLLKELRELKKNYHDVYCAHGNLSDAVTEVLFNWRESRTPPTEQQLDYLRDAYDAQT
jgi:hypothetical protein